MDRQELAEVECNTHCNIMQHYATWGLHYTATHYNTLNFTRQIPHLRQIRESRAVLKILECQLATQFTIWTDCIADFWEILQGQARKQCMALQEILKRQLATQFTIWTECMADFWEFLHWQARKQCMALQEILKRQLATQLTVYKECIVECWEFRPR